MLQGILFLFLALYDAVSDVLESSVISCIEVAEITQTLKKMILLCNRARFGSLKSAQKSIYSKMHSKK